MRYQSICIRHPSKLSRPLLFSIATLLAWIAIAPSLGIAESGDKITRVIKLDPVEGSNFTSWAENGQPPPQATVTLHSFGGEGPVNYKLVARPMFQLYNHASYALYFTTRSSPSEYVHGEFGSGRFKFNTDFLGDINVWGTFAFNIGVDDPQITAFIVYDPDDGRAFNPGVDADRVIFSGTSVK